MKKSRKTRLSWAPDANLCQVKLFLVDDSPSKVSSQPQSLGIQWKPSSIEPSTRMRSPDLPPGFEGNHCENKKQLHRICRNRWRCPPKFIIGSAWRVAAGEESTERQIQNLREAKVFEAVYPHRSAIPSHPSVSRELEAEFCDDSKTPVVRLTPVEEEEEIAYASSHIAPQTDIPTKPPSQSLPKGQSISETPVDGKTVPVGVPGLGADISVAASAALTALVKSKERGSMIDTDLLVKIFSDPKMVENLLKDQKPKLEENEIPHLETKKGPMSVSQPQSVAATFLPLPSPSPDTSVVTPMAADRNSHPLQNGMLLKPGFTPLVLTHALPLFESKRLELAVSVSSLEPTKESTPSFGNGNPRTVSTWVQPSSSVRQLKVEPVQTVQATFNGLPLEVNHPQVFAGSKPLQKLQPAIDTLPMKANLAVRVSAGLKPVQLSKVISRSYNLPMNAKPVQVSSGPKPDHPVKGLDYFKNLIREHGTAKPEIRDNRPLSSQTGCYHVNAQNINTVQNIKPGEIKAKIQKPCMYFQSSRGCKLGANCMYQHDTSSQWRTGGALEAPSGKRTKFGGEVTGR